VARPRRAAAPRELRRFLTRLGGGRLVYGKPVRAGERVVVPVSRVRMAGGFGFGGEEGEEGGGGGVVDARPVGFLEVGPEGTRYEAIPSGAGRLVAAVTAAVAAGVVAAPAVRRLAREALPRARRAVRSSSRRGRLPSPPRSLRR
jgi:uncharacterized spore protein YtfJ